MHLPPTGEQLRDDSVSDVLAADAAIHRDHRPDLERALDALAASGRVFTADDVRDCLAPNVAAEIPPALLPAMFRAYVKAERIRPVGFATSRRPSRHAGVLRQWIGRTDHWVPLQRCA